MRRYISTTAMAKCQKWIISASLKSLPNAGLFLASQAVAAKTENFIDQSQPVIDLAKTEEQAIMRRRYDLMILISSLDSKRNELEARLVELINVDHKDDEGGVVTKISGKSESSAGFRNEWEKLSPKKASVDSKEPYQTASGEKGEATEKYIDFDLYISPAGHAVASTTEGQAVADLPPVPPEDIQLTLKLIEPAPVNLPANFSNASGSPCTIGFFLAPFTPTSNKLTLLPE